MRSELFYKVALEKGVVFEGTSKEIKEKRCLELMNGALRANKNIITNILLRHEAISPLVLLGYHPYTFWRTNTHLIFTRSGVEYFFKINL